MERLVREMYRERSTEPKARIVISSELPAGAGLGSSASSMVATVAAVSRLEGWNMDTTSIVETAMLGERLVHGNPSGIDVAVSAIGGVLQFRVGEEPRRLVLPRPIRLLVVYSGDRRSSKRLITKVSSMKKDYPHLFSKLCDSASVMTALATERFLDGRLEELGALMTYNHAVLAMVGASNERLDRLVDLCLEYGCYGAKLTGAGGGGSVLGVAPRESETEIADRLASTRVQVLHQRGPVRRGEGVDSRVVVVKLGGSIVTDKEKDSSFRPAAVASLARAISASGVQAVVVHGGGSFGHPVAKRYGLSSRSSSRTPDGVAETRRAMFDLNMRICDCFISEGLHPYTFSPFPLLAAAGRRGSSWLLESVSEGLTPITFGDVVRDRTGFRVLSGDTIALLLSKQLKAERCVFVMDVDGIVGPNGLLRTVDAKGAAALEFARSEDATGGIALKVREALRIASGGTEVAFVSGFRPAEFSKALKGLRFHGTSVKDPSRE